MQEGQKKEGHAWVCAVCPQHTGCTPADATTDSCDSQSHRYVERRQSIAAAKTAHWRETATWVSSHCVSVQDARTAQSLLKLADLARDATSYGNNVRVDGLHRVF
jgi:hypothetical protein